MKISVRETGAAGDGKTLDTAALQKAIDSCFENGGGEAVLPEGTYLSGDIVLRSGVTLRLLPGATLLGCRDTNEYYHYRGLLDIPPEDISDEPWARRPISDTRKPRIQMPGCRWNNALIRAYKAHDIAVIGEKGSVIDGSNVFDPIGEEDYRGPHGMTFFDCRNVTLEGYTIRNTGNWAHNINFSKNIMMRDVEVLAGHDGIHASVCGNVTIESCRFYTGDDSVAGFANTNVLVENCELNSACSAFRSGGTNMLVRGCHMYGPGRYCFRGSLSKEEKAASAPSATSGHRTNMLSAFTYYADFSLPIAHLPGNIVIEDCEIDMADRFLHYNFSGNETWQKNRPLESITFRNIKATGVSMPITAYGSDETPLTLKIENADIGLREGCGLKALAHAAGFELIKLDNVSVRGFDGDCLVRTWSDGEIRVKDVRPANVPVSLKADSEFFAAAI